MSPQSQEYAARRHYRILDVELTLSSDTPELAERFHTDYRRFSVPATAQGPDLVVQGLLGGENPRLLLSGTDEHKFAGWLTRIAHCNLQDAIRMLEADKRGGSRHRVDTPQDGDSYSGLLNQIQSPGSTPSRHVAKEEARRLLDQAIDSLPDAYRVVVRMHDLEGATAETVGKALNRSPGAVYMLRARAHDRLRALMGDTSNYFTDYT